MYIKQLYTNCLAEAAYYIESDGIAAVIDPVRETEPYIMLAQERSAKIKYVFETHFHADFISGHIDLARETGAEIVYGPCAETGYRVYNAEDGEVFELGKIKIKVLHTPGHTLESSCYLLMDEQGKEHAIFTGDTLFVGDVGRPDLLDGVMSKEELAGMMFDTLNNKIKPLPDELLVYPAHGPGSACGKNIGKETWSTLGEQKKTNYALKDMSKDDFIKALTDDLLPAPQYFFKDARINKDGYESLDEVKKRNLQPLSVNDFEKEISLGTLVLDTRVPENFEKGFVKGAVNIGLNGTFAVWVGTLIPIERKLLLVTDPGKEEESVVRLARVGYENVSGFLDGGIKSWKDSGKAVDTVQTISPSEFAEMASQKNKNILDVRNPSEFDAGHVKEAIAISLTDLEKNLGRLDKSKEYMVHCQGGYRSMISCSILKAHGFHKLMNVEGGYGKIKETGVMLDKK